MPLLRALVHPILVSLSEFIEMFDAEFSIFGFKMCAGIHLPDFEGSKGS